LFEHDLFGKPVPTFPDHALTVAPSRSRDALRPSYQIRQPSNSKEGAGKAGRRLTPMVRVQQKARGRTTGAAEIARPSLRDGFNAYT
jgi:hypothetical protein